jgi:hypothetical protein
MPPSLGGPSKSDPDGASSVIESEFDAENL